MMMPWNRYLNTQQLSQKYDAFKVLCHVLPELSNRLPEFMNDVVNNTSDRDYETYVKQAVYGGEEENDFKFFIETLPTCVKMIHSINGADDDGSLFHECTTAVIFIYTYQFLVSNDFSVAYDNLDSLTERLYAEVHNPLYSAWLDTSFLRGFRVWRKWCLRRRPIVVSDDN